MSIKDTGCNGFASLCDRRLDQVTFAGTHNSMSASADDFFFARQTGGIGAQLGRGVRAFLLDLHYGGPIQDVVRTVLPRPGRQGGVRRGADGREGQTATGPSTVPSPSPAPSVEPKDRKVYLCHLYCELGATLAKDAFAASTSTSG